MWGERSRIARESLCHPKSDGTAFALGQLADGTQQVPEPGRSKQYVGRMQPAGCKL